MEKQSEIERDEVRKMSEELEELLEDLPAAPELVREEILPEAAGSCGTEEAGERKVLEESDSREDADFEEEEEPEEEPLEEEDGEEKLPAFGLRGFSRSKAARKERRAVRQAARRQREELEGEEPEEDGTAAHGGTVLQGSDGLWAAFAVPVAVMLIIFAQRGIYPFGEETFLRTDMYHQYAPFFSEFHHKLTEGGSLLYSWDIGMGVNFMALYAYYLASPLNWLLIFCPKDLIIEFMSYAIVLKIGLSGLSFAWYLRSRWGRGSFGVGFFGIFYALSGYMAAYSWNIMWLDCILLFPLIMRGLERLVQEKKGLLYSIALGVSILSNYYISIMTCIFMVIYFAALLVLEAGKGKRAGFYLSAAVRFVLYSLAAGGLAAAVLLPEIYALQMTASGDFNFPQTVTSYFSIFDMLARHMANVQTEIGLNHWPNIYCGTAVLMFALLYFGCRTVPVREKAVYGVMLFLFFASFSVNVLNFIWHGFHYPNSLPCRQSFIYIFLVLVICYRAYSGLRQTPWKHAAAAFFGASCFVLLAEKLIDADHFDFYVYYGAFLFLALYAGLVYLYKKKKARYQTVMLLALGVVTVEAAVNTTVTSVTTTSRTSYVRDNEEVRMLTETLMPNDTFFRIEKVDRKTKNDGAWMNFPSVSLFSSVANADLTAFFKQMGCEGSTNAYSITGSTPLVDSLFSVKYGLYGSEQAGDDHLLFLQQSGGTWLYMRYDTLPVGFMVDPEMEEDWQRDLGNPASVQNDLCDVIGAKRVLRQIEGENIENQFLFTAPEDGEYYVYIGNRSVEQVTVYCGEAGQTFDNVNRGFLLELGRLKAGDQVTVTGEEEGVVLNASGYRFDLDGLHSVYEILNRYPLQVTSWTDTSLSGVVDTEKAGLLFTSIPYDKGWTVKVDGIQRETQKIFDTFLAVEVPDGAHTIEFTYMPQGLLTGAAISGGSVLFLAAAAAVERALRRRREENEMR